MIEKFLERWNLTAEEMFNEYWGIVKGKQNGTIDPRDSDIYETRLVLKMREMIDEGNSTGYALRARAWTLPTQSLLRPFGLSLEATLGERHTPHIIETR